MGRLGPLSQPHIPSGLSLATPTLTNSQCCPPFWILRFLTFLLLVWPLRIMDLNAALLTSLVLYSLSQMPRRVTHMDVWVAHRTIPGASFMIVCDGNGIPEPCNVATSVAREEIMSYTTLHPWKKNGHTHKDPWTDPFISATKYSVHGVCQAQGHNAQWSRKKSIM